MAEIDSYDDALTHIRRLKASGACQVKNYNQPRRNQRQQVIEPRASAASLSCPRAARCSMDIILIQDGNSTLEHDFPQPHIYNDVLSSGRRPDVRQEPDPDRRLWRPRRRSLLVPALPVRQNRSTAQVGARAGCSTRASRRPTIVPTTSTISSTSPGMRSSVSDLGVPVSIGGHGQRQGLGDHWEFWSFVRGGMSTIEALRNGTVDPARLTASTRTSARSSRASSPTSSCMDKNPLDDIHNTTSIRYTMINGELLDSDLNAVAGGTHRTRPFWFQQSAGGSYSEGTTIGTSHEDD